MGQSQVLRVLEALRLEGESLCRGVGGVGEPEWEAATRCAPWSARELLGHVAVVVGWLPGMLAALPPARDLSPDGDGPPVGPAGYYRPDERFSARANAARIDLARRRAAEHHGGAELVAYFAATCGRAVDLCRAELLRDRNRLVRTRHGDAMLLSDFLVTRVVEVAVHGLDLADALGREPWLTPEAGAVVLDLLLDAGARSPAPVPAPAHHDAALSELGWDTAAFLRKATGRVPLAPAEAQRVEQLGLRWLALG